MDAALQTYYANILKTTGKSVEQWVEIVRQRGAAKHGEIVSWLKTEGQMGHGYANLIAHTALQSAAVTAAADRDLVAEMFKGKEDLRPIFDDLLAEIRKFGSDVEVSPKKTYLSLRRKKQFALLQPSTRVRLDVGLNLKNFEPTGKLEPSGSFNAMCSHRVRVESAADLTADLVGWLRAAYAAAG